MPVNPLLPGVLSMGMGIESSDLSKNSPEKIRDAASQFEALLISQVLKAAHESEDEGWLGTGEDQTASSMMGLAEDYFARAMASRGGFGLARMVSSGLERRVTEGSVSSSTPAPTQTPAETPNTID